MSNLSLGCTQDLPRSFGPLELACRLGGLEELLEVLGAILASLIAMFGVGVGMVFAANVGDTREEEFDLIESFLVVS